MMNDEDHEDHGDRGDHEEDRDVFWRMSSQSARMRDAIVLEIASDDELAALCVAIGNAVATPAEAPLTRLLRKLAPDHPVLVCLDRLAEEYLAFAHESVR